jgi:hypothetical protein
LGGSLSPDELKSAEANSEKAEDFVGTISRKLRKDFDDNLESALLDGFNRIRGALDTDKAIYRLMLIGVVEDYTKDYGAKVMEVTIRRRSLGEYREILRNYLERWEN